MIEMYKHFYVYARETLSGSFQPRQRSTRAHKLQNELLKMARVEFKQILITTVMLERGTIFQVIS